MNNPDQMALRFGVLCRLIARAPAPLGRTAVMKLAYLLQTVKDVPLGYDFRLHTYGPFDSEVLNDLEVTERFGLVNSEMITFHSCYGYQFTPGPKWQRVQKKRAAILSAYDQEVDWALREFGQTGAADLELLSTIVYADREASRQRQRLSFAELTRTVKEVKPRFADDYIEDQITKLASKGLLVSSR